MHICTVSVVYVNEYLLTHTCTHIYIFRVEVGIAGPKCNISHRLFLLESRCDELYQIVQVYRLVCAPPIDTDIFLAQDVRGGQCVISRISTAPKCHCGLPENPKPYSLVMKLFRKHQQWYRSPLNSADIVWYIFLMLDMHTFLPLTS